MIEQMSDLRPSSHQVRLLKIIEIMLSEIVAIFTFFCPQPLFSEYPNCSKDHKYFVFSRHTELEKRNSNICDTNYFKMRAMIQIEDLPPDPELILNYLGNRNLQFNPDHDCTRPIKYSASTFHDDVDLSKIVTTLVNILRCVRCNAKTRRYQFVRLELEYRIMNLLSVLLCLEVKSQVDFFLLGGVDLLLGVLEPQEDEFVKTITIHDGNSDKDVNMTPLLFDTRCIGAFILAIMFHGCINISSYMCKTSFSSVLTKFLVWVNLFQSIL